MSSRAFIGLAVVLAACSEPARDVADAQLPPDGPHCGNGVFEYDLGERCDEGTLNGTSQSLCTKQCEQASSEGWLLHAVPLDLAARRYARVEFFGETKWGVAYTAYDDAGVHVLRNIGLNQPLEPIPLKVEAAPVALGAIGVGQDTLPLWVEAATDGLHLYMADLPEGSPATIHEVPYPFPDGAKPQLFVTRLRSTAMLVDQSTVPPYDLLVALFIARTPTDITTKTLRVAAPGRARSVALEHTAWDGATDKLVQQVVQFFEDTSTFVAFSNVTPDLSCPCDFDLYESGRGNWPFKVVGGWGWHEGAGSIQPPVPTNSHPPPLVTLTDTGDLYIWQFVDGISGESFVTPFGHMPTGTRVVGTFTAPIAGVWGVEPDGKLLLLNDADPLDLRSGSLMPQEFPGIEPWTELNAGDSGFERAFVADGTLWTDYF